MTEFRDLVTVVTHLCKAYREIDSARALRRKREEREEREEKKRRERQKGAIDVEYRVVEE